MAKGAVDGVLRARVSRRCPGPGEETSENWKPLKNPPMFEELSNKDAQLLYLFKSIRSLAASDSHLFKTKVFPVLMGHRVQDSGLAITIVDELRSLALKYCGRCVPCEETLLSQRPFGEGRPGLSGETPPESEMGFVIRKSGLAIVPEQSSVCFCVLECVRRLLFKFLKFRAKHCVETLLYLAEKYSCDIFEELVEEFWDKKDVQLEILLAGLRLVREGRLCEDRCGCPVVGCTGFEDGEDPGTEDLAFFAKAEGDPSQKATSAEEPGPSSPGPWRRTAEHILCETRRAILAFPLDDHQSTRFVLKNTIDFLGIAVDSDLFLLMHSLSERHTAFFLESVHKLRTPAYDPDLDWILRRLATAPGTRARAFLSLRRCSNPDVYAAWVSEPGEEGPKSRCLHLFLEDSELSLWTFLRLWKTGEKGALVQCLGRVLGTYVALFSRKVGEDGEDGMGDICASLESLSVEPDLLRMRSLADVPSAGKALEECVRYAALNHPGPFLEDLGVFEHLSTVLRKSVFAILLHQKWRHRKALLLKLKTSGESDILTEEETCLIRKLKDDRVFIVREMAKDLL